MKKILSFAIVISVSLFANPPHVIAGEPDPTPLNTASMVQDLIKNTQKHVTQAVRKDDPFWTQIGKEPPTNNIPELLKKLPAAQFIQSKPLAYQAFRDPRPHEYEQCFCWAQVKAAGKSEWWLLVFYRLPKDDKGWLLSQDTVLGPYALAAYSRPPTSADGMNFLKEKRVSGSYWDFPPKKGFARTQGKLFDANFDEIFADTTLLHEMQRMDQSPAHR
jgi:hypothetical protein